MSEPGRTRRWVGPIRVGVVVVAVLVVACGAGVARVETMTTPILRQRVVLSDAVRFPGPKPAVAWPDEGEAAVSVEGVGNLGSSGGDTPVPIASLAKVMTAYLVLRDHPLAIGAGGFSLTITAADVADEVARQADDQSTVAVAAGEVLDEYQLLEALLLPSANNIAPIVAAYDAGTSHAFVVKMNAEAKVLGMDHTDYTDPSGFMPTTVSTAADQLRVAKVAMRVPVFAQIVDLKSAVLPVAGKITNYNGLVGKNGFFGIKTGSDSQAGGCLAFAEHRQVDGRGVTIVGVVVGQDRGQTVTATLLDAVKSASSKLADSVGASLAVRRVLPAGRAVVDVTNAEGDEVVATTSRPVRQLGWGGLRLGLRVTTSRPSRQLDAGQQVAIVVISGHLPASAPVAAAATMPKLRMSWRAKHLFDAALPVRRSA